jgi:hypothetical protein
MLTTSRKIEIAQAVMEDTSLGHWSSLHFQGMCDSIDDIVNTEDEFYRFKDDIRFYFLSLGLKNHDSFHWFITSGSQARTVRIEFLKKYIQHLKDNDNEQRR